jgi:uncharacterized protein YndB with AHSA1/START domain
MRVEASIVIDRSPDDVFAFLAVRDNDPVWMSAVEESNWLDSSARLAVGRRGRMALKMFGRRTEYVDEVTAFEPGRRIAHRTVEGPFQLSTACLCVPDGDSCRTTVVADAEKMFGRFVDPLVARLMRRGFRKDLVKLKSILEKTAQDRPAAARLQSQP